MQGYVQWYNTEHYHSQLGAFTPAQVFTGDFEQIVVQADQTLLDAYARHPERFGKGPPSCKRPPDEVCINPVVSEPGEPLPETIEVNVPTLPRAREALHQAEANRKSRDPGGDV